MKNDVTNLKKVVFALLKEQEGEIARLRNQVKELEDKLRSVSQTE